MIKVVTWQYVKPAGAHFIFVRIDRIALSPNRPFPCFLGVSQLPGLLVFDPRVW